MTKSPNIPVGILSEVRAVGKTAHFIDVDDSRLFYEGQTITIFPAAGGLQRGEATVQKIWPQTELSTPHNVLFLDHIPTRTRPGDLVAISYKEPHA